MHFREAVSLLTAAARKRQHGFPVPMCSFVSPVVSTMLAAMTVRDRELVKQVVFAGNASDYAAMNGVKAVIDNSYEFPVRGGRQGRTYTRLTPLSTESEVDACNAIVGDLLREQLDGYSQRVVQMLMRVVGELHDNVASHARGLGYSCAQVYSNGGEKRLEFSIADAGCGMLRNVTAVRPAITEDVAAVEWCLQRGNTTARTVVDPWAQRLPEDSVVSPYPDTVATRTSENHHVGEGLWQLQELVKHVSGSLWLISGNAAYRYAGGSAEVINSQFRWEGVAIEISITVPRDEMPTIESSEELENLAKRLGL